MARFERKPERPWSVPVSLAEVPETGRHFDLAADEVTRIAIARLAALSGLPRLEAAFDLTLHGRAGLHVIGHVSATVEQTCVVTLDPVENQIEEAVDLIFVPADAATRAERVQRGESDGIGASILTDDPPEVLRNGMVDLGAIATEFLLLGIDPYPRKAGAVFREDRSGDDAAHPFAALAALKKGQGENAG
jgi:uncharacterized metal-binding protein YceD (DUF177 family)